MIVFLTALVIFFPKNNAIVYINHHVLNQLNMQVDVALELDFISYSADSLAVEQNNNAILGAQKISILPLFMYNTVNVSNITLKGIAASTLPPKISTVFIRYTPFVPHKIFFTAQGDFGTLEGDFYLFENKVILEILPSALMKKNYGFILNQAVKKQDDKSIFEYVL